MIKNFKNYLKCRIDYHYHPCGLMKLDFWVETWWPLYSSHYKRKK